MIQLVLSVFAFAVPMLALLWLAWRLFVRTRPAYANVQNITLPEGPGLPAVGTVLSISQFTSPQTYIPVGNVGNIKIGMKNKTTDVTNQGTPWTQIIATLHQGGTLTCDIHAIPGSVGNDGGIMGHGFISGLGSFMNGFTTNVPSTLAGNCFWRLQWPNGATIFFTGPIAEYSWDMNLEKDVLINMSIEISGEPVFAAGS